MLVPRFFPSYNYSDYKTWQGNWELIQGIPISLLPSPKRRHQTIASEIHGQIYLQLRECNECSVLYKIDWIVSQKTVFQPDIMVICESMSGDYVDVTPSLVIEILSESTKDRDTGIKYQIYEEQKVDYYVIVDGEEQIAFVYQLLENKYQLIQKVKRETPTFYLKHDCIIQLDFTMVWNAIAKLF